ncbi:ArsR/SmtB family transcription factor [Pseudoxanthomonas suwonensis]|jgi:Predicted transcriptional regulator|uniref:ArsR/SmtB family transcription factor n=1 Tax=Pseudoxanthomonas suwonensis TaxID=314722 RepID=UPI00138F2310|nr:helix-turn-helix domain-containing protein [Pseudoxanthomonas suwonensis]KAF1701872.1 transcriptional regulator [Pseudoxanthomonas suwonensis]
MVDVFDALSAEVRRLILDELSQRDGQALYELCARLAMKHDLALSRQAISQHLEVLEAAGLVRSSREGRSKFHFIDTRPLEQALKRWRKPGRSTKEKTK